MRPIAAVKARSEFAIFGSVAFDIGIEQEQIAAADFHAPHFGADRAAASFDVDEQPGWPSVPMAASIGNWVTSVSRYSSRCQPLDSRCWRK